MGSSTRILEERRFVVEEPEETKSEKLAWVERGGGNGDRDREVERELCAERGGRAGICIVRERRRDKAAPPVPQGDGADAAVCLRLIGESGGITVDGAELRAMTLDEAEELSGLSQGRLFCRRKEPGLI